MKVLHNSCNMCTLDFTDMYALALGPVAPVLGHKACNPHACTYISVKSPVHTSQP